MEEKSFLQKVSDKSVQLDKKVKKAKCELACTPTRFKQSVLTTANITSFVAGGVSAKAVNGLTKNIEFTQSNTGKIVSAGAKIFTGTLIVNSKKKITRSYGLGWMAAGGFEIADIVFGKLLNFRD